MRMMANLAVLGAALLVSTPAPATSTVPIDLNGFSADPSVTVAPDGGSARMEEDALFGAVFLANDPSMMGEPGIPVPAGLQALSFFYEFIEGAGNDDEFVARILDHNGATLLPDSFFPDSVIGTHVWDLSSLGLAPGSLIGVEFQLFSLDFPPNLDSFVYISNAQMTVIPLPATFVLMASAIAWLPRRRRKLSVSA